MKYISLFCKHEPNVREKFSQDFRMSSENTFSKFKDLDFPDLREISFVPKGYNDKILYSRIYWWPIPRV